MDSRMRGQGLSPGWGNIVVVLSKKCFASTDLRSQMEAQRCCSLTKAEKRVFLQVIFSYTIKGIDKYL